ncbi:pilus assembly protein PilI [Methylophaga sp. 42_25_T18]|nr:pilus assembly protein PilI [Methylophaga sp. 42_25_T18]OUR87576.1 pilus assembly protein PilI [Methylophaga sp. 42_8_T64]
MAQISSPSEIIALLKDIERRSQQQAAGLSQQDDLHSAWTAIGFRVGEHHFLIPLSDSREVFPVPEQHTPVPKAESWVYGIANIRGELLPLFDLKHFLLGKQTKTNKRSRIMVINHPELYSGLLVDEVFGLKHFQREPEALDANKHVNIASYLKGSVFQQDTHWDVFSFQKLAEDPRFLNAAA